MRIEYGARIQARNALLFLPAVACFVEAARAPTILAWGDSPGAILTGTMGFFLLIWALSTEPHPIPVIVAGYVIGTSVLCVDLGLIGNNIWSALILVPAFACFGYWKKIEKLWKR